ncbi:MAG: pyroglutamyl-peptidase I family protein [Promethearchaeota archaeon]
MIILTGFEPYGRFNENISSKIVNKLFLTKLDSLLIKKIFPVSWELSLRLYNNLLSQANVDLKMVIMLGIHTKKYYSIEKYGWNFAFGIDVRHKIRAGFIKYDSPLIMKSSLNIKQVYQLLKKKANISISYFPGTYLCNYIYYLALIRSKNKYPVLFIHIPYKEKLDNGIKVIEELIETVIMVQNMMV